MKKFISMILTCALVLAFAVPVSAAERIDPNRCYERNSYTVSVNEYDVYVEMRNTPTEILLENGVSQQMVDVVKSGVIETELLRLSNLSVDELADLGYDSEQIQLLKEYSGEPLEDVPALRGAFADMDATPYVLEATTNSISVMFMWEWSNSPVIAGTAAEDIIGVVWQATGVESQQLNAAYVKSDSSCSVSYYTRNTDVFQYSQSLSLKTDDPYGHAYATFTVGDPDTSGFYAKTGAVIISTKLAAGGTLAEMAFVFGYGHAVLEMSPSLSLPESFGIGFTWGTESMCENAIRVTSDGKLYKY